MGMYQKIADNYDFIFPYKPAQKAFVLDVESEKGKLLDIGCSTGALAMHLADHFDSIIAIDLSSEMIEKATERKCDNVRFLTESMLNISTFSRKNEFDLVTCFGNTIVHLATEDEILDLFKQIRKVLRAEGTFLGQIINYDLILDENRDSLPTIENEKIRFVRDYHIAEDQSNLIFETELTIKESSEKIVSSENLIALRKETLEKLLLLAGFETVLFYSDFSRSTFDSLKLPLVFEAK